MSCTPFSSIIFFIIFHCISLFFPGKFGDKCEKPCTQRCSSGRCNKLFGYCECDSGLFGPKCNLPCPDHTYGPNCRSQCKCVKEQTQKCNTKVIWFKFTLINIIKYKSFFLKKTNENKYRNENISKPSTKSSFKTIYFKLLITDILCNMYAYIKYKILNIYITCMLFSWKT